MRIRRMGVGWWCGALLALTACDAKPVLVASNCDTKGGCVAREPLKIDAVDILFVIDDSPSMAPLGDQIKNQLPRLLNALTSGDGEDAQFPPAKSVHVAVTTPDLGAGEGSNLSGCMGWGRDGTFVKPTEFGLTCDVDYPGYLAFEGGPAAIATVDTVSCVPLVGPPGAHEGLGGATGYGCGFEQPLEAALKALAPHGDDLTFVHGHGHGDEENAGFLRDNSLLVLVIVADEDDCSAADYAVFDPESEQNVMLGANVFCHYGQDKLFDTQRYVEQLKNLRPHNDNVVFVAIGGMPVEWSSDEYRGRYDLQTDDGARAYYEDLLADPRLVERSAPNMEPRLQHIIPSCERSWRVPGDREQMIADAYPPRRLIEVAKGFGARSVVQSVCGDDFGPAAGRLIRSIGEQLSAASED